MSQMNQDRRDETESLDKVAQLEHRIKKLESENKMLQTDIQQRKVKENCLREENEYLRANQTSYKFRLETETELTKTLFKKIDALEKIVEHDVTVFENVISQLKPHTTDAASQTKSWRRSCAEKTWGLVKDIAVRSSPVLPPLFWLLQLKYQPVIYIKCNNSWLG